MARNYTPEPLRQELSKRQAYYTKLLDEVTKGGIKIFRELRSYASTS